MSEAFRVGWRTVLSMHNWCVLGTTCLCLPIISNSHIKKLRAGKVRRKGSFYFVPGTLSAADSFTHGFTPLWTLTSIREASTDEPSCGFFLAGIPQA